VNAPVYIHSVASTRITNKPSRGFYGLCLEVGRAVLNTVSPLEIDSFYIASMDPGLFGVTGEIAASITSELGMLPRETLGIRGTSSAGGIGLIPAYKDIASGQYGYTLVIACEQMNGVAGRSEQSDEARAREREAVQSLLRGVITPEERRYGLSMILIGDMLESALLHYLGLSRQDLRRFLPGLTMSMYARAAIYPYAHFYENTKTEKDYLESPMVSPHYRRDDVVPPSTAACAILLSSKPPRNPLNGRVVRLKGIGQGFVHPALTRRFGPFTTSAAVRRAIYTLAQRADISSERLRRSDIGFPHDAFPSVSRLILKEIGLSHDESLEGLLSGRYNPCGGLVKCGHPVGCSGELQLARAFQQMTYDPRAIDPLIQQSPADSAFAVSVGAALTNIIAVYLEAYDAGKIPAPCSSQLEGFERQSFDGKLRDGYNSFEKGMACIPGGDGVVLANTRSTRGWVHLIQMSDRKVMALHDEDVPPGALVALRLGTEKDRRLNRLEGVLSKRIDEKLLKALGIIGGRDASRGQFKRRRANFSDPTISLC